MSAEGVSAERAAPQAPERRLRIGGMHCASCVRSVENALTEVEGVADAQVNLVDEIALVRVAAAQAGTAAHRDLALVDAVEAAGYQAEVLEGTASAARPDPARDEVRSAEHRDRLRRFRIGVVCGAPVVVIGHWEMIPGLPLLAQQDVLALRWLSCLLTLPIVLYVGRRFFTDGWAAARRGAPTMDTLVALGTGAAWLYSTTALLAPEIFPPGAARPFYEAVAVVITLVVLGQAIEARAKAGTASALHALLDLAPPTAERLTAAGDDSTAAAPAARGASEVVPVEDVSAGDRVLVRPGDAFRSTAACSTGPARWTSRWSRASRCRCCAKPATR